MWTSLLPALMAILLFSDPTTAVPRKHTVTVGCDYTIYSTITVTASPASDTALSDVLLGSTLSGEAVSLSAMSSVTSAPLPGGTMPGIFFPVTDSSGAAQPTISVDGTGNQTNHLPPANSSSTDTNTAVVPFFTLENTASVTAPTAASFSLAAQSASEAILSPSSSLSAPPTTTSTTSTTTKSDITPIAAAAVGNNGTPFLRGVNLGGWLVLEKWMNADAFTGAFSSAVDQWTFDSTPGAASALQTHWSTFFTEADIQAIAATGINALRIPIGFWAYDNANTPFITGADAYLEQAIGWARNANMKVWVDCHGSPGSQNGYDNSGRAGSVDWQQTANLERSTSVLKTMAAKYGAMEYADVVVGLELTNEPISWGNNAFGVTQSWAQSAYAAVKAEVANENLVIVMHDAFQGPLAWTSVSQSLVNGGAKTFGVDTHLYQLFSDSDNTLTQAQHITEACGWGANLASANAVMPTYVGEWSAATNICVNPDGSTSAGTSCSVSGCQCQSADFSSWNSNMIEQVRKFVEAQLDVFESSSSGYFIWSAKGPGGWGFLNGIGNGAIPNPVTSRKYPGQCGSGQKRRENRGSLGAGIEAF